MDHMQTRHSMNWSEKIHTERWYCDADHPGPSTEPPEFDEKTAFVNHLKTDHGSKLTQSQLQGRIRRNRWIATRDPFVCPLCDCIPPDIEKHIGERPYKLLWEHTAEHLKSLAFLSLSYVGNDLEDRASITDSAKTSDKDDPRISRGSLGNRDLENFDDIPSTTVYSKGAQVEGEDFYEEASLGESENWDFLSVKSLSTDYKHLKKHLTRSQVSLESDIDSDSKHCRDTLSLAANTLEQELPHGDYRGEYNRGLNLFDAPDIDDSLFIGRDTELEQMKTVLLPNPTSPTREVLVLGGMGGIGKTQLAVTYAKRYGSSYSSVFWLNASSKTALLTSLRRLAREILPEAEGQLEGDMMLTQVSVWLSNLENPRWLLIFDDYNDPNQFNIREYFPSVTQGSIIITTRQPDGVSGTKIKVRSMVEKEESLRILVTRSRRENVDSGKKTSPRGRRHLTGRRCGRS
jgi:hypothetical protein